MRDNLQNAKNPRTYYKKRSPWDWFANSLLVSITLRPGNHLSAHNSVYHKTLSFISKLHFEKLQLYCNEEFVIFEKGRSQWPRDLRRRSAAARLLRSWVRIPTVERKFVYCWCCVFSGRGLCDELITRPEESYRLWCVVVCDLETSWMRRSWPTGRLSHHKQTNIWEMSQIAIFYQICKVL